MPHATPLKSLPSFKLAESLAAQLKIYAYIYPDVYLLDADLGDSYGLNEDVIDAFGDRFIQTGIAEQCMVSAAAGMAAMEKRPWVFSFAAFLSSRAYDQIRCSISQMNFPVTLVGANAGIAGIKNGNTHVSLNDIALLSLLPNIEIWSPYSASDLRYAMEQIMLRKQPAYLRLSKFGGVSPYPVRDSMQQLAFGDDILLLSSGAASTWVPPLLDRLGQYSVSVQHINITRIKPLPEQLGEVLAKDYQRIYTLEDHICEGGLGDHLARAYPQYTINKIGWPATWLPATKYTQQLRSTHALDTIGLSKRILGDLELCNKSSPTQ